MYMVKACWYTVGSFWYRQSLSHPPRLPIWLEGLSTWFPIRNTNTCNNNPLSFAIPIYLPSNSAFPIRDYCQEKALLPSRMKFLSYLSSDSFETSFPFSETIWRIFFLHKFKFFFENECRRCLNIKPFLFAKICDCLKKKLEKNLYKKRKLKNFLN